MSITALSPANNWFAKFQDPGESYESWRNVIAFAVLSEPTALGPVAAVVSTGPHTALAHELPGFIGLVQLSPEHSAKLLLSGSGFIQEFHPLSPNRQ